MVYFVTGKIAAHSDFLLLVLYNTQCVVYMCIMCNFNFKVSEIRA